MKMRRLFQLGVVAAGVVLSLTMAPSAKALSGADFNPGRIMDDSVFFNKDAMSAAEIQTFLQSKVPVCDTYHVPPAGIADNRPWTCLYQYYENTTTHVNNIGAPTTIPAGAISGAQIIYNAAQTYNISPKVLLVLLQKEQSLITDSWPYPSQYRGATGYGCPDTSVCDSQYYGFYNQVTNAARQFRLYANNPSGYNYAAGRNNNILYNPNAACGYQTVYIQNQATAGLYNYTPYVPNAAALNNLYGLGDSCSAYGNRNFWRLYNDWFGSTLIPTYSWQYMGQTSSAGSSMVATQKTTWTVSAKNTGSATWSNSGANPVRLGTSKANDRTSLFCTSTWLGCGRPANLNESTVAPGQVGTFSFTVQAPTTTGSYKEYFNLVAEGKAWMNDPGLYFGTDVAAATYTYTVVSNTMPANMSTSSSASSMVTVTNNSNVAWYKDGRNPVNMGTASPIDRTSKFAAPSWPSSNRPARMNENVVAVGQNATFTVPLIAPSTTGTYNEVLSFVSEGYKWFSQTFSKSIIVGSQPTFTLQPGQNLNAGQSLISQNNSYRLVMQSDGNLVVYSPNRAIWQTGTAGKPANKLSVQSDGNVVLYGSTNYYWATWTQNKGSVTLVMQDDGNLVLYNGSGQAVWNSGTAGRL